MRLAAYACGVLIPDKRVTEDPLDTVEVIEVALQEFYALRSRSPRETSAQDQLVQHSFYTAMLSERFVGGLHSPAHQTIRCWVAPPARRLQACSTAAYQPGISTKSHPARMHMSVNLDCRQLSHPSPPPKQ